jgi:hypothetical protein
MFPNTTRDRVVKLRIEAIMCGEAGSGMNPQESTFKDEMENSPRENPPALIKDRSGLFYSPVS